MTKSVEDGTAHAELAAIVTEPDVLAWGPLPARHDLPAIDDAWERIGKRLLGVQSEADAEAMLMKGFADAVRRPGWLRETYLPQRREFLWHMRILGVRYADHITFGDAAQEHGTKVAERIRLGAIPVGSEVDSPEAVAGLNAWDRPMDEDEVTRYNELFIREAEQMWRDEQPQFID
jgi:hypothetical protein